MELANQVHELGRAPQLGQNHPKGLSVDRAEGFCQVYEGGNEVHILFAALLLHLAYRDDHVEGAAVWTESTLGFRWVFLRDGGEQVEDDPSQDRVVRVKFSLCNMPCIRSQPMFLIPQNNKRTIADMASPPAQRPRRPKTAQGLTRGVTFLDDSPSLVHPEAVRITVQPHRQPVTPGQSEANHVRFSRTNVVSLGDPGGDGSQLTPVEMTSSGGCMSSSCFVDSALSGCLFLNALVFFPFFL